MHDRRRRFLQAGVLALAGLGLDTAPEAGRCLAAGPLPPAVSRTMYEGRVGIVPATLAEREARLRARGCRPLGTEASGCRFRREPAQGSQPEGIRVWPRGLGFGPVDLFLASDRLHATSDLPGPPDEEAYRRDVRARAAELGDAVQLVEGTWKLDRVEHPWDVRY